MIRFFKKILKQRRFEKQLIESFLKEHSEYIPKYSPRGLKLDWNISVYKDGEYDLYTGEFKGEYKVGISQNPPKFLGIDNTCYRYNVKTKTLEEIGARWSY